MRIYFRMKLFGKTPKEYVWPVKYHLLACVLIVISQYAIALPLNDEYPFLVNVTQWAWELIVLLAVLKQTMKHNFGVKNALVLGAMFAVAIHGLKVSIRYLFYGKDLAYVINRFSYGSALVMAVTILGILLVYFRRKKWV